MAATVKQVAKNCWRGFTKFQAGVVAFARKGPCERGIVLGARLLLQGAWCYFLLWVLWSVARSSSGESGGGGGGKMFRQSSASTTGG